MSWYSAALSTLAENSLLQRLCFATLELVVLSLLLALVLRWARFSSQRLVACLWLIVLAKPLVTVAVGSPIVLFELRLPALENSDLALTRNDTAPALTQRSNGLSEERSMPALAPVAPVSELSSAVDPAVTSPGQRSAQSIALRADTLVLVLWGAGVAFCVVRYARVRWQLARMVRRATRAPEPLQRTYAAIGRDVGLVRVPDLRVLDDLDSPALVGLVHPTILLPRRLVENESSAASEWALRHELAHWRWLDPLAILLRDCVSICFFFHPFRPWAVRRHAEAMEMACDWESLRDPSEAVEYAEGLSGILLLMRERHPQRALESSLAMATQGRMVRRIRALLDGERARPLTPQSAVGVLFVSVAVLALGCGVARDRTDASQAAPAATAASAVSADERNDAGKAILYGLRWLARHQNPDGSWSPTTIANVCASEDPLYHPTEAYSKRYDEGLTGLALLCFLRAGFSDASLLDIVDTTTGKRYRLGDIVGNGLRWLVNKQKPDGSFCSDRPFMYSEAIAGMAVAEAYGLTRSDAWKDSAQRSMDFIQAAQRPSPKGEGLWGWRYGSRQEIERFVQGGEMTEELKQELYLADSSVTGWCTMALGSGRAAGLDVKADTMQGALAFTKFVTAHNGRVGYLDRRGAGATVTGPHDHFTYHPTAMSALGMCTRRFAGEDGADKFHDLAAKQVVKDLPLITPDRLSIDYYYWYVGTLALSPFDGEGAAPESDRYWKPWSKAVIDAVLALQDHTPNACTNGGWMVPDRWCRDSGPIYTTALNLLTLEVCDRKARSAAGAARK